MPVAKPHKKARSTKQFKSDTTAWNQNVMSENMYALIDFLQNRGDLGQVLTEARPSHTDLGIGRFVPSTKTMAVIAGDPAAGNAVLAHEIAHAVSKGKYTPRTKRIASLIGKDSLKNYTLPSRWHQNQVGAANIYNEVDNLDLREIFRKAASRRQFEVRASIPTKQNWSGLKPLNGKPYYHHRSGDEESKAWYLTDRNLSGNNPAKRVSPRSQRAKEYGLFLRDYGVPMSLVAPVVEDLIAAPNPNVLYGGGGTDLRRLIDRNKRSKRQ